MKTAQWDTGFFDPSSEFMCPDIRDCDLILRRSGPLYTPSIFCNPNLPKILACVARERALMPHEEAASGRLRTSMVLSSPCGRKDWYRSVLEDIYPDHDPIPVPFDAIDPESRFESTGFCMTAAVSYELPSSGYRYVSLVLPPLWQAYSHPSGTDARSEFAARPAPMAVRTDEAVRKIRKSAAFCVFRMEKSTGLWYSRLMREPYRKSSGKTYLRRIPEK